MVNVTQLSPLLDQPNTARLCLLKTHVVVDIHREFTALSTAYEQYSSNHNNWTVGICMQEKNFPSRFEESQVGYTFFIQL